MSATTKGPGAAPVRAGQLLWLFLPLAVSNGLMALGETVVGASLSRWPDPITSLAAFGSAFNVALVIEGPVIMLLHASNALVQDRQAYRTSRDFTLALALTLTLIHAAVAFTPLHALVFRTLLQLPAPIASMARVALMAMLPWTFAIGWRRFLQGVMIRQGQTAAVGIGTAVRFATLVGGTLLGGVLVRAGVLPGAAAGTAALALSVVAEAAYTHRAARPAIRKLPVAARPAPPDQGGAGGEAGGLRWRQLALFYWPLASTSVIVYLARPVVTAALARGGAPEASLAGWPILTNTLFLFVDSLSMLQQLVIPYAGGPARPAVRTVAIRLGAAGAALVGLMGLTPAGEAYLHQLIGLEGEALALVAQSLSLAVPYPVGLVLQSWFQGILVRQRRTAAVTAGALLNLLVLAAVAYGGVAATQLPGLHLLTVGMVAGLMAEGSWLALASRAAEAQAAKTPAAGRSLSS